MPVPWRSKGRNAAPRDNGVIRKMGHNERYQLAMYVLNQYRGTSLSCRYIIPPTLRAASQRQQLVATLEDAISRCVLRHPVLQVGIAEAESIEPKFVHLDHLDLRSHIEWRTLDGTQDHEAALRDLIASQLDTPFHRQSEQPGWRIIVLSQEDRETMDVLFTWNHPHADGVSGRIFQQDLFRILNSNENGEHHDAHKTHILHLPGHLVNFPPPIEQINDLPLDVMFTMKALFDDNKPTALHRSPTLAHWAPIIPATPFKTQFRSFVVGHDSLSRILSACQRHESTLTSLFHGLALASMAKRLDKATASGFQGGTTISLRRFVPSSPTGYEWMHPDHVMGNFVTLFHHKFEPDLVARFPSRKSGTTGDRLNNDTTLLDEESWDLLWDASVRVRKEVDAKLKLGLKNDLIGTLKYVRDWRSQMLANARKPRQASWTITGLGVLDTNITTTTTTLPSDNAGAETSEVSTQEPTWQMSRAQFALSAEVPASALMISPITVSGKDLCVGVSWQDGAIDARLGEAVTADLEVWLRQMAD